jgi:hypothetical protein
MFVTKTNNRFAALAAVQSETGNFDFQDAVRGTHASSEPKSVPVSYLDNEMTLGALPGQSSSRTAKP